MSWLRLPASRAGVRKVAGVLFFSWVLASRAGSPPPWADFVEPDFPFISSVLDARRAAAFSLPNNLTPRGLILNLGHGVWACFDLDLLRVSAVWTGSAVTAKSMAQSSSQQWDRKSGFGEGPGVLPEPIGRVLPAAS